MKIRNFEKEDLLQVIELCREVREHHINILDGYFSAQNDNFEKVFFLNSLTDKNVVCLVAEEDRIIKGYLLAELRDVPWLIGSKVANIANFGVSNKSKRLGIGKKLMDAFYQICQENDVHETKLGVYNKNTEAYSFYEKYGFEPLEQRMHLKVKR